MESESETCEGLICTLIFSTALISKTLQIASLSPRRRIHRPTLPSRCCIGCSAFVLRHLRSRPEVFFLWNGSKESARNSFQTFAGVRFSFLQRSKLQVFFSSYSWNSRDGRSVLQCSSHPLLIHLGGWLHSSIFHPASMSPEPLWNNRVSVSPMKYIYGSHCSHCFFLLSFFPCHTLGAKSPAAKKPKTKLE